MQSILIVDDDKGSARLLRNYLAPSGYDVVVAGDGETALQTMQGHKPDLLVLKWRLPDRDGLDVMRTIRSRPRLADLPIIIISNYGSDEDRAIGLDRGADDYLIKPFTGGEFVARVRAVLRRSYPESSQASL